MRSLTRCFLPAGVAVATAVLAASLHAAPPETSSPVELAQQTVRRAIFSKFNTSRQLFSRAAPVPTYRLDFQPELLADGGERRLPFVIAATRHSLLAAGVSGYVRLSDQAVFLLDPKTGKHRPAEEDPRFAAPAPKGADPKPARPL